MGWTLESFANACHNAIAENPGDAGREKVCGIVKEVLKDDAFVSANLRDDTGERKILYEDPEYGFCILGHVYEGAKESAPHDHGPTWAIYGQAHGTTLMSDWNLLEPATEETPGKVSLARKYQLDPGDAYYYKVGALHSPSRKGPTRLIRIEGVNVSKLRRRAYEAV